MSTIPFPGGEFEVTATRGHVDVEVRNGVADPEESVTAALDDAAVARLIAALREARSTAYGVVEVVNVHFEPEPPRVIVVNDPRVPRSGWGR